MLVWSLLFPALPMAWQCLGSEVLMLSTIFCASVLALGVLPETEQPEKLDLISIEENIVFYTNQERERYGLAPLEIDPDLMKTARSHANWMTLTRNFSHSRIGVGENIAMGQPTSEDVVRCWMNSRGHRANILNGGYRRIGVAAYQTEGGRIYWCQQFLP